MSLNKQDKNCVLGTKSPGFHLFIMLHKILLQGWAGIGTGWPGKRGGPYLYLCRYLTQNVALKDMVQWWAYSVR